MLCNGITPHIRVCLTFTGSGIIAYAYIDEIKTDTVFYSETKTFLLSLCNSIMTVPVIRH